MKTPEEIEALKRSWLYDPCWNIEETEGFELHKVYLKNWRLSKERQWDEMREAKLLERAGKMGIPGNISLMKYFEKMETEIELLKEKVETLKSTNYARN